MANEIEGSLSWFMAWPHNEITVMDKHKEVHFRYGLAAQKAAELETGIVLLLVDLDIKSQGEYRFEDSLDLISHYSQNVRMLGRLIGALKEKTNLSEEFAEQLEAALCNRNYLIHHFYRERAELFKSPSGCDGLIEELVHIKDHIEIAVDSLHAVTIDLVGPNLTLDDMLSFIEKRGAVYGLDVDTYMANYKAISTEIPDRIDRAFREKKGR